MPSVFSGGGSSAADSVETPVGSPSASVNGGARVSRHFLEQNRIDFGQHLEDGFRDAGPGVDPTLAGSSLVLDRRRDAALVRFVERCRKKLRKAKDEAAQAMVLALLVSDTCGRSGVHAADLARRHARLASERRSNATGELLIGDVLGDRVTGAERRGKHPPTGAALAPHRALLFKALADWLGPLLDCTLERRPAAAGEGPSHILQTAAWNVVQVGPTACLVDLLFDPGALYEEHSAKAQEYRRLLEQAEQPRGDGRSSAPPRAPSCREELGGQMPRPPWHVEPWELDIHREERIGRGGFGEVFHGRWAGVHVAVKEIKDTTPTDADVVDFILEIALLSQLNHPNIVRFWRGCAEVRAGSRSLLMVTEYVKQGGLSRLLHGHGGPALPEPLTLPQALSFGLDIARGVQYLHSQRILHLDLKSPNVLCAPQWTAKLCDFGLAKIRGEQTAVQSTLQGVSPVWAPPEMFDERSGGLTEKADVYSFAIILFELLTKRVPFQEVSAPQLPALKAAGQLPLIPGSVPEDCADLIRQCCAARLSGRPSMSGVVARMREVAQARGLQLADVRAPAPLARADDGQEHRVQEAEEAAAQRLVDIDGQRTRLRAELRDLQQRLERVRRRALELSAAEGEGGAGAARGARPPEARATRDCDDAWCEPYMQEVAGSKFRCGICSKLFRGPDFVRRHVVAKHRAEVRRLAEDAYFDCDVSREDSLPAHRSIRQEEQSLRHVSPPVVVGGRFSQALQDAAEHGDAAQVAALLRLRADARQRDDGGTGPLALAARGGHVPACEALLAGAGQGAGQSVAEFVNQVTGARLTPLHMAASEGHCEVLATLLRLGAAVDALCAQGKVPLLHAGENGHAAACTLLIGFRADAGACQTPDGETLLHVAARFGDAELVASVVAWRADLQARDRDGWTPLHEAAHWGTSAVEALCRARAEVHARSRDGETPLHVALEGYEQAEVCEVLVRWCADPLAPDVDGERPLHVAARRGNVEVCRFLLLSSAEVNAADHTGRRPLDLARRQEVRSLLRAHGAEEGPAAAAT